MTDEERLENAVDVIRGVVHRTHRFACLADNARALRGYAPDADDAVKHFELKQEEEWERVRPALRELMRGDNMC